MLHRQDGAVLRAQRSQHPECTLARQQQFLRPFLSLAFDDEAVMIYGRIRAELAARGTLIGPVEPSASKPLAPNEENGALVSPNPDANLYRSSLEELSKPDQVVQVTE